MKNKTMENEEEDQISNLVQTKTYNYGLYLLQSTTEKLLQMGKKTQVKRAIASES
jgi:hypothetical protein